MKQDDLKDFFEEDAYSDLLNLYAQEEDKKSERDISSKAHAVSSKMPLKAPRPVPKKKPDQQSPSPASKPKFEVNIAGLDEEFKPTPQKPRIAKPSLKSSATAKAQSKAQTAPSNAPVIYKRGEGRAEKVVQAKGFTAFFMRNIRAFIAIAVCIILSIGISTYAISCLNDIFAVRRDSETPIEVQIPVDADTGDVLKILKDHDLIKHRFFCGVISKLDKFRSDNYLTGVYYFTPSMGFERMLLNIKQPTQTGETITLTFPEGFTVDQIMQKLEENKVCAAINMQQVMQSVDFSNEFPFIKDLDDPQGRYRLLEGYMYPDTYDFYVNENPTSVVRKFLTNFQKKWNKDYAEQAKAMNMSVDDVITLASIIQKESAGPDQSPLISSVLHNRLNKSSLYPSLQSDTTTEYIENYIKKNVGSASAIAEFTAKYSTYKCEGLPVGAICNPGDDAIKAALNPKKTNYYFFAHDANKKIYLARNDADRRANNITILNENAKAEQKKTQ